MKNSLLMIAFIFWFVSNINGQQKETIYVKKTNNKDKVYSYSFVKDKPIFYNAENHLENDSLLISYIDSTLDTYLVKISFRKFVKFTIKKSGEVENVNILNKDNENIDAALKEIILNMPKWRPGSKDDEFIKVSYTLEINHKL